MFFRHYKAFIASVSVSVAGLCAAVEAVPTATLGFADPFVLLENGTYYAYGTYAGDGIAVAVSKGRVFWDPDYAVGYALADKPEGPWRKSASNPILRRFRGLRGTGHHSLFKDKDGKWRIVFHTHASPTTVGMRRTYIADLIVGGTPDAPELSVGGELIPCMLEP